MGYFRTVTVCHLPERRAEGVQKLKEFCHLLNRFGATTEICTNIAGGGSRIHLVSHFETLAQFEALSAWAVTDATYQAWLQSVQDLFDWSQTQTHLYQVID